MTETAALVTLNHPFHVGRGTLGKPLPGREVRISPEGEIMVRGDVVSGATWANGSIQPRASEWLATGDLATQDDSGELRFSGRRGDVLVTAAGLNIYPADLEAALLKQPGVRAAAVVGCEGANGVEPVAVLLTDGNETDLRKTLEPANRSLADFQQIRHALRWPEPSLPFTSTGKLLRRVVAEWAAEQLADQLATTAAHPASSRGDVLPEMIASVTGESPAAVNDSARLSEDLHLDSLGRVQLQSLLEQRFGIELGEEQITEVKTLGELRALARSPTPASTSAPQQVHTAQGVPQQVQPTQNETASEPAPARTAPAHRYLRWPWLAAVNAVRVAFQELIIRPLVWLLAAPRVERRGTPIQQPRPLLIIANHITAYDPPLVLYGLPPHLRRRVAVAMSGEILMDFRNGRGAVNALLDPLMPIAYWLITVLFNVFPLPRLGGFRRSFEHAGRALDRGYSVLIFPEGQRSADGTLQPFRSGIGLLAQQAEADVLPVALVGFEELLRSRRRWFHAGRIAVRIGEPIPYDPRSTPEQTTQRLQAAMAALLP